MVKAILILSILFSPIIQLIGQADSIKVSNRNQNDKTEYIFDKKKINTLGLYISPEMGVGKVNSIAAPIAGGSFMMLINKKMGIGFSGHISGNPQNNKELLKLGYGGVKLEYTIKPNGKVHASFPLLIGTAFANNDTLRYRYGSPNGSKPMNYKYENHNKNNYFFIVQPGVNVEANLMKFIKIFAGVNYRLATKNNNMRNTNTTDSIAAKQVSGITATIGLKFGLFDYNLHKKDSLKRKSSAN